MFLAGLLCKRVESVSFVILLLAFALIIRDNDVFTKFDDLIKFNHFANDNNSISVKIKLIRVKID